MPKIGKLTEGFETLPAGTYTVQIKTVGDISESTYGEIIKIEFEVTAPRKAKGKTFSDIFGWNEDELSLGSKLYKMLKAANGGDDLDGGEDLSDFEGMPFLAQVEVVRKNKDGQEQTFNKIASALPIPRDDDEEDEDDPFKAA
jgi:hypothetical protein